MHARTDTCIILHLWWWSVIIIVTITYFTVVAFVVVLIGNGVRSVAKEEEKECGVLFIVPHSTLLRANHSERRASYFWDR